MALVLGTNCGFVTTAPTGDPEGTSGTIDGYAVGFKVTSPDGNNYISEIGWWMSASTTEAANYECCIYTHNATYNRPDQVLGEISTGQVITANTPGWYKYTGLTIEIEASTIYWIGVACANTGSATIDYATSAGNMYKYKTSPDGVAPDPWSGDDGATDRIISFYAVYQAASSGISIPVLQSSYRRRRS